MDTELGFGYQSPDRPFSLITDNEEYIQLATELNGTKAENEELRRELAKLSAENSGLNEQLEQARTDTS